VCCLFCVFYVLCGILCVVSDMLFALHCVFCEALCAESFMCVLCDVCSV